MSATLVFDDVVIAPDEFERRAARAASGLAQLGVGEGDVVALMLRNEPVFLETMFACRRLGAFHCPINWHFKADEAGFLLADSGAKVLVIHAELLAGIEAVLPPGIALIVAVPSPRTRREHCIGDESVRAALDRGHAEWSSWRDAQSPWSGTPRQPRGNMPYTSGTTGRPKGVRRMPPSAREQQLALEVGRIGFGVEPGMRSLLSAPLYHSGPNQYGLQSLLAGEMTVLEPRFDAESTLALIARHRLTHLYLVPTMYVRLLRLPPEVRARHDISTVKHIASTGSPCAPEIKRAMIAWWGPVIHDAYGASETGLVTAISSKEWLAKPGSAGRTIGEGCVKVLDDDGKALPAGQIGTLYIRQPAYPDFTYNNNPEARAAIERDGLWTMGDMGYVDGDGFLFIVDRKSDMVIAGGVNIYPAEIEAVLSTLPEVADCAVFGIPDAEYGEALAAAIQLHPGMPLRADELQAFLRARIAGYKVPRVVTFHESLPREDSGKIFKRRLREPYWRATGRQI